MIRFQKIVAVIVLIIFICGVILPQEKDKNKNKVKNKMEEIMTIENIEDKITEIEALIDEKDSYNSNQLSNIYKLYYKVLINNGRYRKLLDILSEYFDALNIQKPLIKAQVYNEVAFKLATQNELIDESINLAKKAFNIVKKQQKSQYNLGVEKWENNINIFLASIEDTLGLAYYKKGNYKKSEKMLKQSIKYLNNASEPYFHLGLVYTKQNKLLEAYKQFLYAKYLIGTEVKDYEESINSVKSRLDLEKKEIEKINKDISEDVKKIKGIGKNKKKDKPNNKDSYKD